MTSSMLMLEASATIRGVAPPATNAVDGGTCHQSGPNPVLQSQRPNCTQQRRVWPAKAAASATTQPSPLVISWRSLQRKFISQPMRAINSPSYCLPRRSSCATLQSCATTDQHVDDHSGAKGDRPSFSGTAQEQPPITRKTRRHCTALSRGNHARWLSCPVSLCPCVRVMEVSVVLLLHINSLPLIPFNPPPPAHSRTHKMGFAAKLGTCRHM